MAVAHQHFVAAEGVTGRAVGDESVLLDMRSGVYFSLNAVGALIWDSVTRGDAFDTIVTKVVEQFEVDPETARDDVAEFLDSAVESGLIARA